MVNPCKANFINHLQVISILMPWYKHHPLLLDSQLPGALAPGALLGLEEGGPFRRDDAVKLLA